jgi:glutathione S-transferase
MRLLYTPNSPFARKARVLVRERQASGLVEEQIADPFDSGSAVQSANPLGKVPALVISGRSAIFDSPLIVEYLDSNLPGAASLPPSGEARWRSLRYQALADGIMDAGVSMVFEKARSDSTPSARWMDRWRTAILGSVAMLEDEVQDLPTFPDVGAIAVACALCYLDFRHAALNWRADAEKLVLWLEDATRRPSMTATEPGP